MEGLKVRVVDPNNNGANIAIDNDGSLHVIVHPHPPSKDDITTIPFRQYFTTTGLSTGTTDMRVNGSVTNVPYYITAQGDTDIYIKTINVKLADAGAKFNLFGTLAALTNGVEFSFDYISGQSIIHEGIKSNIAFNRLTNQIPTITDLSGGGADSIIVEINLASLFGLPWGIKLRAGFNDRITFTVKDNLSAGLNEFNIIGYGIKI